MHNTPSRRIACRKVGKEQTNPNHSPGDLCLISLQRALGKGATALVYVFLTWNSETSEKLCLQGLYWHCNFLTAGTAKNKAHPLTPRTLGPHPTPKKDPGFADLYCQPVKHQVVAQHPSTLSQQQRENVVHGLAPSIIKPVWMQLSRGR